MSEPSFNELLVEPESAIKMLESCIESLETCSSDDRALIEWHEKTAEVLESIFLKNGENYLLEHSGFVFDHWQSPTALESANRHRAVGLLRHVIKRLSASVNKTANTARMTETTNNLSEVFIVHGHDEAVREKIETVITKLGLVPIVLNKKANSGLTIAEKLEKLGKVGFAVVAFTADDLGGTVAQVAESDFEERPRPNVLIELGYFWGKLGRERLCILNAMGDGVPSDLKGLGYTSLQNGDVWKFELAKELRSAGYNVDVNKLLD